MVECWCVRAEAWISVYFLTTPLKRKGDSVTPCLDLRYWCQVATKALVKQSTSWLQDRTYLTSKSYWATVSLTKWRSISRCLDLAWPIGLAAKEPTLMLSHQISGQVEKAILNSFRRDYSQVNSTAARAKALYSDYVLDRDTTCFLDDHKIIESPK